MWVHTDCELTPGHFLLSQGLVGTDLVPSPSQIKVDKSCALEHVTRDRVRGGQRRRPPTRIHLKEVGLPPAWTDEGVS